MRMWNVPVVFLCDQHLLGEHRELHMFVGCISRGTSVRRYLDGLLEVHNIQSRHDLLAEEMIRRGINHKSPLSFSSNKVEGFVNKLKSLQELVNRCEECKRRVYTFVQERGHSHENG